METSPKETPNQARIRYNLFAPWPHSEHPTAKLQGLSAAVTFGFYNNHVTCRVTFEPLTQNPLIATTLNLNVARRCGVKIFLRG